MVIESQGDILNSADSAGLATLFSSPSNGISSWHKGGVPPRPGVFLAKSAESIENKRVELLVSAKERASLRCIAFGAEALCRKRR